MTADDYNESVDLSALDLLAEGEGLDARVAAVMRRAAPLLESRRSGAAGVVELFVAWTRPMLVAASVVGVLSLGALARYVPAAASGQDTAPAPSMEASVAQGIGVPSALATWVANDGTPGPGQLLDASRTSGDVR